jgi:ribosomal protein S18 acetylase RimI-like enzyme
MSESISLATLADIPQLCILLEFLFTQEAEFQPDLRLQSQGLEQIIKSPEIGHILVLRRDDSVIGIVNLLYSISTALGGLVATVDDVIIHPDYRGDGRGSRLFKYALNFAQSQGCKRVTLLTDCSNLGAQKFYQSHGLKIMQMVPMRIIF